MNYLLDAFIFVQSNKFTKITLSPDPSNVEISSSLIKKNREIQAQDEWPHFVRNHPSQHCSFPV